MSGHNHSHADATLDRKRLIAALGVTVAILAAEVVGAALSGSLALLADAGHMFTDASGLVIALIAASLALRPATPERTWGYKRAEVLAAALQAGLLLVVGAFILVEAVRRLIEPPAVGSGAMLWFGVIGLAGNAIALLVLAAGRHASFNLRAAFLEVLNDALGSSAVIIAAVVIAVTGWTRADALVSLLIGVLIIPRTLRLLKETTDVLLAATPKGLDLRTVREHMLALPHVLDVHDLHATLIGTGTPVITGHVTLKDECLSDGHSQEILAQLQECVAEHFDVPVEHSTFQLESAAHRDQEHLHH
ncbi:cation diffusion facilitator family transporter [Sinomonas sp. JGH33]|uniref:Cation diffusion facilitator family transporter n=1 Tax=Sinomonas terricola TaxID=3110330 RepID=A0ABU5TAF7_9MICC|nr:cation diffusion facilitator family transporter [Sinomonas sp. JGH33]MEA5456446.1 cation diffusion facilitator family transporter [Sinomonas sp. JGH33]